MSVAWYKEILTKMLRSGWFLDISQIKELPHEMDMSWDRKAVVKNYTKFLTSIITRMQSAITITSDREDTGWSKTTLESFKFS